MNRISAGAIQIDAADIARGLVDLASMRSLEMSPLARASHATKASQNPRLVRRVRICELGKSITAIHRVDDDDDAVETHL
jgi:hypothetical protein